MIEAETVTLAAPVNERDHMMGPANARVTVVNYGDYQCPGCHERHRATEKMARELQDTVRLVHRHFPLVKSHPRALRAAEAAEAASEVDSPLIVPPLTRAVNPKLAIQSRYEAFPRGAHGVR